MEVPIFENEKWKQISCLNLSQFQQTLLDAFRLRIQHLGGNKALEGFYLYWRKLWQCAVYRKINILRWKSLEVNIFTILSCHQNLNMVYLRHSFQQLWIASCTGKAWYFRTTYGAHNPIQDSLYLKNFTI